MEKYVGVKAGGSWKLVMNFETSKLEVTVSLPIYDYMGREIGTIGETLPISFKFLGKAMSNLEKKQQKYDKLGLALEQ